MSALPSPNCPDGRCDGSGFLYDEVKRTARPCSCRPARLARKKATAVQGRLPRRFREVSFEREPLLSMERRAPHVIRAVRQYCRAIAANLDEGRGLWLFGGTGTGKTTLAMLVSKHALEAGRSVAIYSVPRLLTEIRRTYDDEARRSDLDLLDRLAAGDLLYLDDLGAERTSEWVLEQLYSIINARYEDGRSLIVTTNAGAEDLEKQIGVRTVSRLAEMCEAIMLLGDDQRQAQHAS